MEGSSGLFTVLEFRESGIILWVIWSPTGKPVVPIKIPVFASGYAEVIRLNWWRHRAP